MNFLQNKLFYNDLETTGVDPKIHGVVQIAFILADAHGNELAEYSSYCRPFKEDLIDPAALEVTGLALSQLETFPNPADVYHEMRLIFSKHGKKGNKDLRFIPAGYNNQFDLEFLLAWMTKIDGKFAFWDFLQMAGIDVMPVCRALRFSGILNIPNAKLSTVCEYLKIPIKAHDALSDVRATKILTERIYTKIFEQTTGKPHCMLGPL